MPSLDFDDKISQATFVFELEDDRERPPFDASEFDSLFEDEDFNSAEHKELFRSHWMQVGLSQGFDLELDKPLSMIGGIMPIPKEKYFRSFVEAEKLARLAVGINNCKPVSKKLEFVEVQKLNMARCSGFSYFITFLAKDCSSGRLMVYQTKIHNLFNGEIIVAIFREKPEISASLQNPSEMSCTSLDSIEVDEAKDYDNRISKSILIFEVQKECEEISSDESELDESEFDNCSENKSLGGMVQCPTKEKNPDLFMKAEKLAMLAIRMNNCRPIGKKIEFVEVQKLKCASCSGLLYFITFLAKNSSSGRLMEYEAEIHDLTVGTIKVVDFREKNP